MAKKEIEMFKKIVSKQLGADIFNFEHTVHKVSTGSFRLDDYIGGGISNNKILEIFGGESSGKSSLATIVAVQFQTEYPEKAVGILDVENVWNHEYAKGYGLDYSEDKLVFTQPGSADEALALAEKMLESGLFSLVIVDSVAAMLTKKQLSGDIGDATIGELARLMAVSLPRLNNAVNNTNTALMFINQTRSSIGTFSPVPGGATSTPGGKALKFFCSLRLEVKRREFIVKGTETIGQEMRFVIRKNKFGRNNGYTDVKMFYDHGFKPREEIVELCKDYGIIESRGAWVYFEEEKWNGLKALNEAVLNDDELYEKLLKKYTEKREEKNSISLVFNEAEDLSTEEVGESDE